MQTLQQGIAYSVVLILAWGLNSASHAQTNIQTIIANAQALAASEPITNKTIPVFSFDVSPISQLGTYWSLQLPNYPPMPGNPFPELPIYEIDSSNHVFLIDDRSVDFPGLWALLDEQAAMNLPESDMLESMEHSGGAMLMDYGTNLWLEIPAVTNGVAYVVLHNVQQDEVYELMSKRDLGAAMWNPEQALHTVTNQDWIATLVPVLDRTNALFFWARDWTGIDENTNTLPDWWEFENFGDFNQSADRDYDGDGVNNGLEYTSHTDPNKIVFALVVTNQYVGVSSAFVQVKVRNGVPASQAVLVDSTNFAGATWAPYTSSNITVNLGANEGWHKIRLGLRGRMATSLQTWSQSRLKLDLTPPRLGIVTPASTNLSQPMIQLKGWSSEPVKKISYDLTNALGCWTNQRAFVADQFYDTNVWEFTTNYFQALDIELTNGVNTIHFHATDRAGNVTVTNFSFMVDYSNDTNPPAISLHWPQSGARVAGDSFTWRGVVDDATANVTVSMTDTNGLTNVVEAIVERDGKFFAEDLPLNDGTNYFTLIATDVVGNAASTNIGVVKVASGLAINPLMSDQLTRPLVDVSGTIGLSNYTVWVNGVRATQTNGTWSATNVPAKLALLLQAAAIANSDNAGNGSGGGGGQNPGSPESITTELEQERPSFIYLASYHGHYHGSGHLAMYDNGDDYEATTDYHSGLEADISGNGSFSFHQWSSPDFEETLKYNYTWPADNASLVTLFWNDDYRDATTNFNVTWTAEAGGEDAVGMVLPPTPPDYNMVRMTASEWQEEGGWSDSDPITEYNRSIDTELELWTGGKRNAAGRKSLFRLYPQAVEWDEFKVADPEGPYSIWDYNYVPAISPVGDLFEDGYPYAVLAEGQSVSVKPEAAGVNKQLAADAAKFVLKIQHGNADLTDKTVKATVGQQITLDCVLEGMDATSYQWTVPNYPVAVAGYDADVSSAIVDKNIVKTNPAIIFYWVEGGSKTVACNVRAGGQELLAKTVFNVKKPNVQMTAEIDGTIGADTNFIYNLVNHGNWTWLHFGGTVQGSNATPGIKFGFTPDLPGEYAFVQVGNSSGTIAALNGTNYSFNDSGVDNGVDTNDFRVPMAEVSPGLFMVDDSPAALLSSIYTNVTRQDSFTMYLLFKPDTLGKIFVPLKMVNWNWSATAILTNSAPNRWSLISATPPSGLSVVDALQHPTWTNHLQPQHWAPRMPPVQ